MPEKCKMPGKFILFLIYLCYNYINEDLSAKTTSGKKSRNKSIFLTHGQKTGGLLMYKVILIDDEIWGIRSINSSFEWKQYGFEVIGEYTDAEEAMEAIYASMPDVICTDMKMAGISGIDLMKKIKGKVNAKFVVISAYKNFEYAKESINYDVVAYCVKPVGTEEASNVLKRLRDILDKERGIVNINEQFAKYNIEERNISNKKFVGLLNYIINNFDRKLSLGELADMFNINDSYCTKLFNRYFNCGFAQFVNKIRVKNAADLIKETDLSINEICIKCGFNEYSYFNKVFKKQTGMSPNEYRNSEIR
jgi:two-component system response regulator YesN